MSVSHGVFVRKLLSWMLGIGLGATVGALLVILFAPASGQEIVTLLKRGWDATLEEARQANTQRRAELEADLARRQNRVPQLPE
jgi:gas vesicle protein